MLGAATYAAHPRLRKLSKLHPSPACHVAARDAFALRSLAGVGRYVQPGARHAHLYARAESNRGQGIVTGPELLQTRLTASRRRAWEHEHGQRQHQRPGKKQQQLITTSAKARGVRKGAGAGGGAGSAGARGQSQELLPGWAQDRPCAHWPEH